MFFHIGMKYLYNLIRRKTSKAICERCKKLYWPKLNAYNNPNLIHLQYDVINYGPFDNFSSFLFENKLQKMENLVRRGGKPLEQIVRQMWGVDTHHHPGVKEALL
jgi:hypothetical protein